MPNACAAIKKKKKKTNYHNMKLFIYKITGK